MPSPSETARLVKEIVSGESALGDLGSPISNIADASEDHTVTSEFDDAEIKGHLDALGGKVNAILAALEEVKLMASS